MKRSSLHIIWLFGKQLLGWWTRSHFKRQSETTASITLLCCPPVNWLIQLFVCNTYSQTMSNPFYYSSHIKCIPISNGALSITIQCTLMTLSPLMWQQRFSLKNHSFYHHHIVVISAQLDLTHRIVCMMRLSKTFYTEIFTTRFSEIVYFTLSNSLNIDISLAKHLDKNISSFILTRFARFSDFNFFNLSTHKLRFYPCIWRRLNT